MVSYLRPLVLDGKFLSFIKNDIEGAGMNKDGFVSSIKESEINEGQMRAVRVKGKPICWYGRLARFSLCQIVVRIWGARLKAEFWFPRCVPLPRMKI